MPRPMAESKSPQKGPKCARNWAGGKLPNCPAVQIPSDCNRLAPRGPMPHSSETGSEAKILRDLVPVNPDEAIGLLETGGQFGDQLAGADADAAGQRESRAQARLNRARNGEWIFLRVQLEEGLIDGEDLYPRREFQ